MFAGEAKKSTVKLPAIEHHLDCSIYRFGSVEKQQRNDPPYKQAASEETSVATPAGGSWGMILKRQVIFNLVGAALINWVAGTCHRRLGDRTVDEWKVRADHPDNHWLDCLVGWAVKASSLGVSLTGEKARGDEPRRVWKVPEHLRVSSSYQY